MLTKAQLEKYADVMVWAMETARTKNFRKGDVVRLWGDPAGSDLTELIFPRLLDKGYNVIYQQNIPSRLEKIFFKHANDHQIGFIHPGFNEFFDGLNGSIYVYAPDSITHLAECSKKVSDNSIIKKTRLDICNKNQALGKFGWTLCAMPTEAQAEQAKMSLDNHAKQIAKACYLNFKDPISEWKEFMKINSRLKKWLNRMNVDYFHIESKNTDLKVFPGEKRRWLGARGCNIPSFELFLSPDSRKTEGTYFVDRPSFVNGNYVEWMKLKFKDGKAVQIDCNPEARNFVREYTGVDDEATMLGEFSLTDRRFSKIDKFMANTLFDENYGGRYGNSHVALGNSYTDSFDGEPSELENNPKLKKSLGFNDSRIHWDIVNAENKVVTAHLKSGRKERIYENGKFTLF